MSILKLSKNDIIKTDDANSKIKLKKNQLSYDSSMVSTWESSNKDSLATLNKYTEKLKNNEYMSSDDLKAYRKALDSYIDSTTRLRTLNKSLGTAYDEEDEKKWNNFVSSANTEYDSLSKYYSQFDSEDAFKAALAYNKEQEKLKTYDVKAAEEELKTLTEILNTAKNKAPETDRQGNIKQTNLSPDYLKKDLEKKKAELDTVLGQYGVKSVEELEALVNEKSTFLNRAKFVQKSEELTQTAINAPDFEEYSQKGAHTNNPSWEDASAPLDILGWKPLGNGKEIGNMVTFAEENKSKAIKDSAQAMRGGGGAGEHTDIVTLINEYMTDDEKAIYNYYVAKEGTAKANEYLDSIKGTLQARQGQGIYEDIEGNLALEYVFGAVAGLDQFTSGIKSLMSDEDYIHASAVQVASGMVREDLKDDGFKLPDFLGGGSIAQAGYDMITTTANMAPSILLSSMVNTVAPGAGAVVGAVTLGASASGNAYAEMLNLGYNKNQARAYSALVGASEAGLQYALGGIGALGGGSSKVITKLLSKVDNAFFASAIKLGGSMLSEGIEESLQTILEPWFKSVVANVDYDAPDVGEVLYSGLLGALSAGILEGGGTVAGEFSTSKAGKQVINAGAVDRLAKVGSTFAADSVAYQLAGKINENTGAYTVGRLLNEVNATLTDQNMSEIVKSLERKGVDPSSAQTIAKWLYSAVEGETFTEEQIAALEENEVISKTFVDVIYNENSTVNQRRVGYNDVLRKLADEVVSSKSAETTADPIKAYGAPFTNEEMARQYEQAMAGEASTFNAQQRKLDQASKYSPESKASPESEFSASEDGKTTLKTSGEEVSIKEISSIKDGEISLRLDNGNVINAKEVNFATADEALIYEAVTDMNAASANAMIAGFDPNEGIEVNEYILGFKEAYKYGSYGFPASEMSTEGFSARLTEAQKHRAYNLGKIDAKAKVQKAQEAKDSGKSDKSSLRKGKVIMDTDADQTSLTKRQKTSIKALEVIAENLGVNIHIFESATNEKGEHIGKNGWYDPSDNSIHIDLYAGAKGESTILFTAAHELTHFIREWSPAKFKIFADFLMEQYGEKGVSIDALVNRQIAKAKQNGRNISYDVAYEEVVADSTEAFLVDSDAIEKLASKDKALWEKIKSYLSELVVKIKNAYTKLNPDSVEGNYVRQMRDTAEKLHALWTDALIDAGETYSVTDIKSKKGTVKQSFRGIAEDGKKIYESNFPKGTPKSAKSQRILDYIQNVWSKKPIRLIITNGETSRTILAEFDPTVDESKNSPTDASKISGGNRHGNHTEQRVTLDLADDYYQIASEAKYNYSKLETGKDLVTHNDVKMWHYFVNDIYFAEYGEKDYTPYRVTINVKEKNSGDFVYSFNAEKESSTRQTLHAAVNTHKGANGELFLDDSISQPDDSVKSKFSLRDSIEETENLVAVHNLTEEKLLKSLKLGGLPMPSIAIIKAKDGHSEFGDISLVFGKDTIDPQAYRSNKVYSGDAWPPSYPRVEYKLNEKSARKIRDKIKNLVSDDIQDALGRVYFDFDNLTNTINRHSGDMATAFRYDYTMKYAYLIDKGINIELPMVEKPISYYSNHDNGEIIKVAEAVSKDDLLKVLNGSHEEADLFEPVIRKAVSEYMTEKYSDHPEILKILLPKKQLSYSDLNNYANEALTYLKNGLQQTVDYKSAKPLIDENIIQTEYEKWVNNLFSDIVEKEGIRNNKDYFTPSGNRRSFEALHYEHNLENVIKAMKEQGDKGIGAWGGGNIFGASVTELGSIEAIKGASERLHKINQDDFMKIKDGFTDRFFELAHSLPKNSSLSATDDAANMLIEAVTKFNTKSGMANYLRRESAGWANYSDYIVDDLIELVTDIRNMPTAYFEAKPKRAVGFDEVATAIIPDSSSRELKNKLEEWKIDYIEYESKNEDSRLEALNSIDNVKFSDRDSDGNSLTLEQQEFFKDSKVRDQSGNLLVMYHGTPNAGFTKFKSGTYFTEHKWYADRYQSQGASSLSYKKSADNPDTYAVYLNINKPFDTRNKTERDIFYNEYYRKWGTGTDLMESGLPDWLDGMDLQEFIEEMGYDYNGLILDEGGIGGYGDEVVSRGLSYVVFDSSQVKNIDNKSPTSDPDIRYSERDNKYLDAINSGDIKTAKSMVDEAAKAVGYNIKAYHGSDAEFTVFDITKSRSWDGTPDYDLPGFYFSESAEESSSYGESTKEYYIKIEKPYEGSLYQLAKKKGSYRKAYEFLVSEGYDGYIDTEMGDGYTEYVVLQPQNVKSADPVTYDHNGNIIPLSQRFSNENNDIRYSDREDFNEVRDNLINKYHINVNEIIDLANSYIENYGGMLTKTNLRLKFLEITEAVAEGISKNNSEPLFRASEEIKSLAAELVGNPKDMGSMADELRKIKKYLRKIRIKIPIEKGDFDTVGGFDNFRKKHINSLVLAKDGIAVDSLYPELQEIFGRGWFPDDVVTVPDQLLAIADIVDTPLSSLSEISYDIDDASEYTVGEISERIISTVSRDLNKKTATPIQRNNMYINDRDPDSVSNRSLLADALESAAKNDIERNKLKQYKEKIALLESEQAKLSELKQQANELRFKKGRTADETKKMRDLEFEANQTANRINTYDRQLLNLESTKALKGVLEREKKLAYKKAEKKGKEALSKYREKAAKTQRDLLERHQQSRKEAIDKRHRTEMRHKIKSVVSELNQLLLHGSKERNIKLALQPAVASALEAVNFDTVAAEERVAKYNALIAKATDPDVIESLTRSRDNIQSQGDAMASRLENLRRAYADIKANKEDAPDHYRAEAAIIEERIDSVISKVGNTPLRNMTLSQLEAVYELYRMVLTTVRNVNSVFKQGKLEDLQNNVSSIMTELSTMKTLKEERTKAGETVRGFSWNEMIPVYAFERIGSKTFTSFFWETVKGQNTFAEDISEADDFATATRKKYGYNKWDVDKIHEFKLTDGRNFRVSLKHMMSIYAYSKRDQAHEHMLKGGFFFNDKETFRKKGGVLSLIKSNEEGYSIDDIVLGKIKNALTKEQILYVDEMQDYLTKMGDKGNEVSRILWGIDIFKEKVYFPLKSSRDFIFQANQTAQEASLKNDGMTKEIKPGASNPIVLEAFDDVWASHVNRMSQYHSFVLPIENLNKIHNYGTWAGTASMSVSTMLSARHGNGVNEYLTQFIQDLNGASSVHGASNPFFSFVSKFKKTAVAASASVVVQQPTAVLRALAVMDMKYFIGLPEAKRLSTKWDEMKKYAPITIIKEIGGFDAGAGRQATEWLNSDIRRGVDKVTGTIDDLSMMGATLGDQLGWSTIWEAVKREIKATTNLKEGSEAFFTKVGERFTEVIVKTQVYDSTLSRSGYMRSKHDSVKMLTAFMGEPTVSFNMLYTAVTQAKNKKMSKRQAGRIIGAVYASTIAASAAASLIYALRDDDDDESYAEKLAEALGGKLLDDINPLNMLPAVRDIVSIFDGWDVERTDVAIFKDIKDAFDGLGSSKKSTWRKIEDFAGAIASAFGLPLKNVMRSTREIYNAFKNAFDGIEPYGIGDAFVRGISGDDKSKSETLYDAVMSGQKTRIEKAKKQYKDQSSIDMALRQQLRENDPRIKKAAKARLSGDNEEYIRIVREIKAEGNISQDLIVNAVNTELESIRKAKKNNK